MERVLCKTSFSVSPLSNVYPYACVISSISLSLPTQSLQAHMILCLKIKTQNKTMKKSVDYLRYGPVA